GEFREPVPAHPMAGAVARPLVNALIEAARNLKADDVSTFDAMKELRRDSVHAFAALAYHLSGALFLACVNERWFVLTADTVDELPNPALVGDVMFRIAGGWGDGGIVRIPNEKGKAI